MDEAAPSSPTLSYSDDSDAVNSSSAKVYFGPVQSPEKKFAPLLSPDVFQADDPGPSNLRRSPRQSLSPPCHCEVKVEQSEEEEEEEDDASPDKKRSLFPGMSWQDTPMQDFLRKDEPSSAIASRIMRAHDNPSPPPKALRPSSTPRSTSNPIDALVFPPIPQSEECSDAAVESLLPPSNARADSHTPPPFDLLESFALQTATIQRQSSISPTRRPTPRDDAEADLISFDHSVLISPNAEIHAPSPRLAQQTQPTIDDLLFSSPLHPILRDVGHPKATHKDQGTPTGLPVFSSTHHILPNVEQPEAVQPADQESLAGLLPLLSSHSHSRPPDVEHPGANQRVDQGSPAGLLQVPGPSAGRTRSPRLSVFPPPPPAVERLNTPDRTPKARSPDAEGTQSRKRRRDGSTCLPLTPSKVEWSIRSDGSDNESDRTRSPSEKNRSDRKRVKKGEEVADDSDILQLAASLSPQSAHVLMTLIASDQDAPISRLDVEMKVPRTPTNENLVPPFEDASQGTRTDPPNPPLPSTQSGVQRPPPGFIVTRILTPSRGSSGTMSLISNSPVKLTLMPAPDDPNRTPAQRVPISSLQDSSRANQGTLGQPNGMSSSSVPHTPVFSRPPSDIPNRSPAKRIMVIDAAGRESGTYTQSSAASLSSVGKVPSRSASADRKIAFAGPSSKRLFLAPSSKSSLANIVTLNATKPSISQGGSRIPRIGALPKSATAAKSSKLPMPSMKKPNGSNSLPPVKPPLKKVAQMHSSSSSGSEDSGIGFVSADTAPVSGPSQDTSVEHKVNRRRVNDKPTPARPMIRMRQVIPGMFGGPVKNTSVSTVISPQKDSVDHSTSSSPVKASTQQRGPIKVREVVKGTLQDFELRSSSFKNLEALSKAREEVHAVLAADVKDREETPPTGPSLEKFTFECPVPERMDVDLEPLSAGTSDPVQLSAETVDAEAASQSDSGLYANSSARRSTRTRRPVQQADVFGTISTLGYKELSSLRLKSGSGPPKATAPPNLIFHTNGLALKTLTNNNTSRNQQYYAQLETRIVRRSGDRPESPTMKLRTILEKQKEEQGKMRAERARRRRAGESSMDVEMEDSVVVQPTKHRRGPGEEEDYETPGRPDNSRKSVKWDRGLQTSVYIDEIQVQPRRYQSVESSSGPRKGCLSTLPNQRAPLDGLGNTLNTDAPLELVPERVVVTKYVYDNDEEAKILLQPKITRSKSKKSR